jgi:hypothetical protein
LRDPYADDVLVDERGFWRRMLEKGGDRWM